MSSIEYMRLSGILKEKSHCFRDVYETGIPGLQDYLSSATTARRTSKLNWATQRLVEFLKTIESLLQNGGPVTASQSLQLFFRELSSVFLKQQGEPPFASLRAAFDSAFPHAVQAGIAGAGPTCDQYCLPWTIGGWRKDGAKKVRCSSLEEKKKIEMLKNNRHRIVKEAFISAP